MTHYLAVYTGTPEGMDAWKSLDASERASREKAGMEGWQAWAKQHQDAIVDPGHPLGKTLRVTADGIAATRNNLGAYTVVQAESQEAAAKMFEHHPHFAIFPGDGVEVMECLPMPGA